MSRTNQFPQTVYEEEAMLVFPSGCTCGPDPAGDCPFCKIYYSEVRPHVECACPPISDRSHDYYCYDDNTYDGAPDAGPQAVGWGRTENEATADFWEQWKELCHART